MGLVRRFIVSGLVDELPKGSGVADCERAFGPPASTGTMEKSGHFCLVYDEGMVFQFDVADRLHSIRYVGPIDAIQHLTTWPKLMMLQVDEERYAFVRATANEA